MVNFESWLLESFDYFQPFRPDRIDQNVELMGLDQKRGVANPSDADLALVNFGELRPNVITSSLGKKRGNQNGGEKVALMPVGTRSQFDPSRTLILSAVLRGLANYIPAAFFRKRNRHCCESI